MLVAATNPCPCGYLGDTKHVCRCTVAQIERYRSKISGPLLDRIDIHIEVPSICYRELSNDRAGEPSVNIKKRVDAAREIQNQRFLKTPVRANAGMRPSQIKTHCKLDADGHRLMEMVVDRLGFSARAYTRILKVARTIADLDGQTTIRSRHLSEAVQYRGLDRSMDIAS